MRNLLPVAALMAAVATLSACERKTTVVNPPAEAPVAVPVDEAAPWPRRIKWQ